MYQEKIDQAAAILDELDVDMWLCFGREAHTIHEPALDLILGTGYTWQSAFIVTRSGENAAIVGSLDAPNIEKRAIFKHVIPYVQSVREPLLQYIQKINPQRIMINYSESNIMADGLTHGMYLQLLRYLEGTPYSARLESSAPLMSALRGRKSKSEIERIRKAILTTEMIYAEIHDFLRPGLREKDVYDFTLRRMRELNVEPAWDIESCPSVFTGMPLEGEAHIGPTERLIERGQVMNMDFGLKIDDYCSDLQRTWYFLNEGETEAPESVISGFNAVRDAIVASARAIRPGVTGLSIDTIARDLIKARGFNDYPHGLGHQVGRSAHDGGGLLCPEWERYGELPYLKLEENQVYTIEPRVRIEGYGTATVEEIVVVKPLGAEFLSHLQDAIWLIP